MFADGYFVSLYDASLSESLFLIGLRNGCQLLLEKLFSGFPRVLENMEITEQFLSHGKHMDN